MPADPWIRHCLFFTRTKFHKKFEAEGTISVVIYHACALMMPYSKLLGQLMSFVGKFGTLGIVIENIAWAGLALFADKEFERSVGSLGVYLSLTPLILVLFIIIRPHSEHGLVNFPIGLSLTVAHHLFGLKLKFWLVAAVCVVFFIFKVWLDRHWLGHTTTPSSSSQTARTSIRANHSSRYPACSLEVIEALAVAAFFLYWDVHMLGANCRVIKLQPGVTYFSFRTKTLLRGFVPCVAVLALWFPLAIVPRLHHLIPVKLAQVLRTATMVCIIAEDDQGCTVIRRSSKKGIIVYGETDQIRLRGKNGSIFVDGETEVINLRGKSGGIFVDGETEVINLRGNNKIIVVDGETGQINVKKNSDRIYVEGDTNEITIKGNSEDISVLGMSKSVTVDGETNQIVVKGKSKGISVLGKANIINVEGKS